MRILAIETSCDETSVAILSFVKERVRTLFHETASQIPIHARYGGVVPEIAARTHVAEILALLDRARVFSRPRRFDAIAVTQGPGLATALRVGIEAARTLAYCMKVPIVGVNHLEGHVASAWLVPQNRRRWQFPILALLVSGGHTELILMKNFCQYRVLGRTRDDAAGEAFDKTAKLMGLGYPGGPVLSTLAEYGDPCAFDVPRPMMNDLSFDFSFSGLKTDVRRTWERLSAKQRRSKRVLSDMCASVQQAIVDVLVAKTMMAVERVKPRAVAVVGGVSANLFLQQEMARTLPTTTPLFSAIGFHTDNAAMIAAAGYWRLRLGRGRPQTRSFWETVDAKPEWDI